MKIYFAGSIRGGRNDAEVYKQVIAILQRHGTVLTEHVGDKNLGSEGEKTFEEYIYQRDVDWITEADIVIAEVTTPSLGVGYEISYAESIGKKVYCLYRLVSDGKKLSAMIKGNSKLTVYEYSSIDDMESIFTEIFSNI